MIFLRFSLLFIVILIFSSCSFERLFGKGSIKPLDPDKFPIEEAVLTQAPNVPPVITRKHSAKVIVNLETSEGVGELAPGIKYLFWRFGKSVPGPMIRVREGDYIEMNFSNHPSSKLPHNIDLHAVTGQGGGAEATYTLPGKTSKVKFRALKPGLFIYHCATAPVGMHIANGMYGLILVQPKYGMPKVDKEFYIVQSDFYPTNKEPGNDIKAFSLDKALEENPYYVVFNGAVGSLTGKNALKAEVGDRIRMYVGAAGPNLTSSFHVIGEIFDRVYLEGGTKLVQENVQTTFIPSGGAVIVDFQVDVPATYILVDHSIFRAFNKGAIGQLVVTGEENNSIITEKLSSTDYMPKDYKPEVQKTESKIDENGELTFEDQIERGKVVYTETCFACHGDNGKGLEEEYPPLSKSDYLMADKARSIDIAMNGLSGPIIVNGKKYDGEMPDFELSDHQIADVLTYIRNAFGNKGDRVTKKEVEERRKLKK